jgi:hypothetical protein
MREGRMAICEVARNNLPMIRIIPFTLAAQGLEPRTRGL